jgi:hypothetical protein
MKLPPLQPCPVPHCPRWTELVPYEETLAKTGEFQKVGWFAPNHKPKTKKVIAMARRLWDKYIIRGCRFCLRDITMHVAGGMLGIMSILASMPIHTFWKASITTLNPSVVV